MLGTEIEKWIWNIEVIIANENNGGFSAGGINEQVFPFHLDSFLLQIS